jgi:hypothetical protein
MPRTWYFWPLVAVILVAAACTVERRSAACSM